MTKIIISLFLILHAFQIFAFEIDPEALTGAQMAQISHQGSGPFDTYLTMVLPFGPYQDLRVQLEKKVGELKHRGEAHITVITPPEFDQVLKPAGVTMDQIDEIARLEKIQNSSFSLVCVGMGKVKNLKTYYAVVHSDNLINIRKKIAGRYKENGGDPAKFLPLAFHPHVTLGFTERDLHESDGVIKDEQSCLEGGAITLRKD